jgi:tRNA dimethylallyltransferase
VLPAETVIIAGPTGAGKTDLALRLAQRLGGEIVGADAFQVYAGLPVLTAQPDPSQRALVPHHLIGCVDPLESFDAGSYLRMAEPVIAGIAARGRPPIVVGGTGLYLKSLLGGLDEMPPGDPELREELAAMDLPTLIARLARLDPAAPAAVDCANRRRVERALEIVTLTGEPLAASRKGSRPLPAGVRALLLGRAREELHARIAANVETMFARGVEAEVAALPPERVGPTASGTLGLREIRALVDGEMTREETRDAIVTATRRYAKRQLTWFRNQHDFPVLNLSLYPANDQAVEEALRLIGG